MDVFDYGTYLRQLEDKALTLDPAKDVQAIKDLAAEHARVSAMLAARPATASAPAGAEGAPPSPGGNRSARGLAQGLRNAAAVTATAPAMGVAGIADLGLAGGEWLDKKLGLLSNDWRDTPYLSPMVSDLTDELAGGKVPHNLPRAAFEGAITAPLSGVKLNPLSRASAVAPKTTAAEYLAGGVAGGTGEQLAENGVSPLAALPASILAGGATGKSFQALSRSPVELLAEGRLRKAMRGLTPEDLRRGGEEMNDIQGEGFFALPSQALQTEAPGFLRLEQQLLASRGAGADELVSKVNAQGEQVRNTLSGLRNAGGQTPRQSDLLADELRKAAKVFSREEGEAVNERTAGLYNTPTTVEGQVDSWVGSAKAINTWLEGVIRQNANESLAVKALRGAQHEISRMAEDKGGAAGLLSIEDVHKALQTIGRDLPAYNEMSPSAASRTRELVTKLLAPLRDQIEGVAPRLRQARELQANLREDLSSNFADTIRQAKSAGGPDAALDAAMKRPEFVAQLREREGGEQLVQELMARFLNRNIDDALKVGPDNLPSRSGPITAKNNLMGQDVMGTPIEGAPGATFQQNLTTLFRNAQDPQAAAEGLNRVLRVLANVSKEPGAPLRDLDSRAAATVARLTGGSQAQQVSEGGRVAGLGLRAISDRAATYYLTRPDVMKRLEALARRPESTVTPAAALAAVEDINWGN